MALKPYKILVVDDLADWRSTLRGLLNDAGYQVEIAGSFSDCCSLARSAAVRSGTCRYAPR